MGAFEAFIKSVLAPGFVAAVVAFLLNTRDERRRTLRDYTTKYLEDTREDIRLAVTVGVAYWSCGDQSKIRDLEAQVLLYESDIRSGLTAIRKNCDSNDRKVVLTLEKLEENFLDALTGGAFESAGRVPDLSKARMLVGHGSILRSELAKLRRQQLSRARMSTYFSKATGFLILLLLLVGIVFGIGVYVGVFLGTS